MIMFFYFLFIFILFFIFYFLSCRSCDSTFGLESLSNEDELCWFSSSHDTEVSEDALKSNKKFSGDEASTLRNIPEYHEVSRPNNAGISINDSDKRCVSMGDQMNSETSDVDELAALSFVTGSDTKPESKDDSTLKDRVSSCDFRLTAYF